MGSPRHFVERHGLVLIVALGETLLSAGAGVGSAVTSPAVLAAAVLGFVVALGLWWLYFSDLALAGEGALVRAMPPRRPELARDAFTLGHFPLLAGVVYVAFGLALVLDEVASAQSSTSSGPASTLAAVALCGGVAVYLAGLELFRWITSAAARPAPLAVASAALVGIVVVRPGSAWTLLALVALVVVGTAIAHARRPGPPQAVSG